MAGIEGFHHTVLCGVLQNAPTFKKWDRLNGSGMSFAMQIDIPSDILGEKIHYCCFAFDELAGICHENYIVGAPTWVVGEAVSENRFHGMHEPVTESTGYDLYLQIHRAMWTKNLPKKKVARNQYVAEIEVIDTEQLRELVKG